MATRSMRLCTKSVVVLTCHSIHSTSRQKANQDDTKPDIALALSQTFNAINSGSGHLVMAGNWLKLEIRLGVRDTIMAEQNACSTAEFGLSTFSHFPATHGYGLGLGH